MTGPHVPSATEKTGVGGWSEGEQAGRTTAAKGHGGGSMTTGASPRAGRATLAAAAVQGRRLGLPRISSAVAALRAAARARAPADRVVSLSPSCGAAAGLGDGRRVRPVPVLPALISAA